jgi:NADPH:quinone reductase-like Zn-dependent oxidoreductase
MAAVVQRRYGAPEEVLVCARVATPVPRAGDVLVRVHAASVHPGDVFVVTGVPYVLRLAVGLRRPGTGVPGRDLAGRVEAVGAGVTTLRPGDAVFGWTATGSLADFVCAPAANFVPKPERLTMAQAATLATSGLTALQALRDVARVQPGQTVLITGASGGVGSFAVQIAKAMGAELTGVCSTRNLAMVRALGADHVVDYTEVDFTRTGLRYDVILDNVEAQPLAATRRALAPTGTLIPNSGKGGRWFGPLGRIVAAQVRSRFTRQHLRPFLSVEKHDDLLALAALVEAGTVTPVVDRTFPLEGAAAALAYVGAGHARGKVVVAVDGSAGVGSFLRR